MVLDIVKQVNVTQNSNRSAKSLKKYLQGKKQPTTAIVEEDKNMCKAEFMWGLGSNLAHLNLICVFYWGICSALKRAITHAIPEFVITRNKQIKTKKIKYLNQ